MKTTVQATNNRQKVEGGIGGLGLMTFSCAYESEH